MNQLAGTISTVIFRNDDFLIARLIEEGNREIIITGSMYGVDKGEKIAVQGKWVNHPKFGQQFEVERWEKPIPDTEENIIAFLSSDFIKGCGKVTAKRIVEKLGSKAIDIMMEQGVASLNGIKGIRAKNATTIIESVKKNFVLQLIISELNQYGITTKMATKIYKKFPNDPVGTIKKNPYLLTKLDMVGFIKADEIALRMGISSASAFRIEACAYYLLKEACYGEGHCFLPEEDFFRETINVLNKGCPEKVIKDQIINTLYNLEIGKKFTFEQKAVYLSYIYRYEINVAQKLSKMRGSRGGEAMPFLEKAIRDYQTDNRVVLAEQQREAIRALFQNNLLILTGGPGTGKTVITKAMIEIHSKQHPSHKIGLCAPTGRAARRLEEATGVFAQTAHSMIGKTPDGDPLHHKDNPLSFDLIIIDEVSMMDIHLASDLLDAVKQNAKILFIGDVDQLPSVGSGNFLNDMIEAGLPIVRLTEIFRQAQDSQIITNAHRVNQGKPIVIDSIKKDFYFLEYDSPCKISEMIRKSALRFIELGYPIEDILVLSPMRKGPNGTDELNIILQQALNPPSPDKQEWTVGKTTYRVGDKVIHIKNNKEKDIYNGEIGMVKEISVVMDEEEKEEKALICNFSGREIAYRQEDLKQLQLAYSITIHKSQGGQAPIVITPISMSHYRMLTRNLIYTGMTRAKKIMVYIGTRKALNVAIQNNKVTMRNTRLGERIKNIEKAKGNIVALESEWKKVH